MLLTVWTLICAHLCLLPLCSHAYMHYVRYFCYLSQSLSSWFQHFLASQSTERISYQHGIHCHSFEGERLSGPDFSALHAANSPVCLPEQSWQWFDWLPLVSAFPLPSSWRGEKSCLHLPHPALWMFIVLWAWELKLLPASLWRSPVQLHRRMRASPLSASSCPANLLGGIM